MELNITPQLEDIIKDGCKQGLTLTGDLVCYYHEGQGRGVGVIDYLALKTVAGGKWKELSKTFVPAKLRDLQLAKPCLEIPGENWNLGYQNLMTQAGIFFRKVEDAARRFDCVEQQKNALITVKIKIKEPPLVPLDDPIWKVVEIVPGGVRILQKFSYYEPIKTPKTDMYIPRYRSIKPDVAAFERLAKLVKIAPMNLFKEFSETYTELINISFEYILSSGDYRSQLGRIKKGFSVYSQTLKLTQGSRNGLLEALKGSGVDAKFEPSHQVRDPQIDFESYMGLMNLRAPFRTRDPNLTLPITDIFSLSYITRLNCRPGFNLWSLNKEASSGFWLEANKGETLYTDMVMATSLLEKLGSCVKLGTFDETQYAAFRKDQEGLFLPTTKNKMEIGKREKLIEDKVWRNYFVFNNFVQLPAQILLQHVYAVNNTDNKILYKNSKNPQIWSLLGWSAYHYGLHDLLKTMATEAHAQGYSIAVYSDNLYLLQYSEGDYWWYSLDGSSMETSISYYDAVYFMRHVVKTFWEDKVSLPWKIYANKFYADVNIDGYAILGNMQWKNVGQFSGQGGTAYLNNAKMITCAAVLDHRLKTWKGRLLEDRFILPGPESTQVYGERALVPELDRGFLERGVLLKVELVTRSSLFENIRTGERPNMVDDQRLRLDLLGFDAIFTPRFCGKGGPVYPFPILARNKLLASLVYNKQKENQSNAVKRVLGVSRLKAFYLLGCWHELPLAQLIRDRVASYEVSGADVSVLEGEEGKDKVIEDMMESVASGLDLEHSEALAIALQSFRIPSFYDVFTVYADENFARQYILSVVNTSGPFAALLFASAAKVVEVVFDWLEQCKKQGVHRLDETLGKQIADFLMAVCKPANGEILMSNLKEAHPDLLNDILFLSTELEKRQDVHLVAIPERSDPPKEVKKRRTYEVVFPRDFEELKLKYPAKPRVLPFSFGKNLSYTPLSTASLLLLNKIVDHLRDSEIKIEELYNYKLWFEQSGISADDLSGIKSRKELPQVLYQLDCKVAKIVTARLQQSNYEVPPTKFREEVVLKRLNRKTEKANRKLWEEQEVEQQKIRTLQEAEKKRKEETRQKKKERKKKKEFEKAELERDGSSSKFRLPLSKLIATGLSSEVLAPPEQLETFLLAIEKSSNTNNRLAELEVGSWAQLLKRPDEFRRFCYLIVLLARNYHMGNQGLLQNLGVAKRAALTLKSMVHSADHLETMEVVL